MALARLHHLNHLRDATAIRNKNGRYAFPIGREMLVQIESIETRQRTVENEATRHKNSFTTQEFPRGCEGR